MFELHPNLAADTIPITELPLCRAVLMNDSRFPWIILVPRIVGLREMHLLAPSEIKTLTTEITTVSRLLEATTGAHKMNVAALGNHVPQLHIHVIARFEEDAAWPAPVWGNGEAIMYEDEAVQDFIDRLKPDRDAAFPEANRTA